MSKIIVFGSYVTDLTARAQRFPVEGETVKGTWFKSGPGGKGSNQAIAAKRAGGDVALITRLGTDSLGDSAISFYKEENLDITGIIRDENESTGAALIEVNEETGQNRIIVYLGACEHFTEKDLADSEKIIAEGSVLVTQLETNPEATLEAMRIGRKYGLTTFFNPAPMAPIPDEMLALADYISVNETEAAELSGIQINTLEDCKQAAGIIRERGAHNILITLGGKGYYADNGENAVTGEPLRGINVVDTTGAGDAFNGAFAAGIAEGMDFFEAAAFGNIAGGLSVTRVGTAPAMPYRNEINDYLRRTVQ